MLLSPTLEKLCLHALINPTYSP